MASKHETRERNAPESSSRDDGDLRLATVMRAAGLRPGGALTYVESHSNDTYLIDDDVHGAAVLRICWRGDVARLTWEAALGRALPEAVGYPAVLDAGETVPGADRLTWSLTRRLSGLTLLQAWPDLDEAERDQACTSLARRLQALHDWRPASGFRSQPPALLDRDRDDVTSVIGASIQPLPIARLLVLLGAARQIAGLEPGLLDAATRTLDRLAWLAPALDDPKATGVIHGDLHLANVWWDGHDVGGLIDLEWARFAPRWVDLGRMHDTVLADRADGLTAHPDALERLVTAYPELVAVDHLDDRMRLLNIAQAVRQLHISPPPVEDDLPPDHPMRLLEMLVD